MSDKFTSMLAILNKIDGGEKVTVTSLMNDLEVSQRSVHRYIGELQAANFPIEYDKQKETYRFQDCYQLKKIRISVEEALTLALAKSLLKNTGPGMESSIDAIEEKLRPGSRTCRSTLSSRRPPSLQKRRNTSEIRTPPSRTASGSRWDITP